MADVEAFMKYLDIASKLGIEENVQEWVENRIQQDKDREERLLERERQREESERERQQVQEREAREHEIRKLEAEANLKKLELDATQFVGERRPQYGNFGKPKLPPLTDTSQIDLYLERFERFASSQAWRVEDWASCLCNLLQGEALSILLSLSTEESANYNTVKETLLRRFNCDRNGFKSKFLSVKPQVDEDFGTYINRAKRYFDRWTELSAVTSKDQLEFLICSEIALQACEPEFVAYIKDRSPANLCELKAVATAYVNARPNKSFAKRSESVSFVVNSSFAQGKPAPPRNNWNAQDAEGGHAYRERNRFGSTRTCSNDRGAYGSRSLSRDRSFKPDNQYSYRKGNSGDLICYRCHGYGHTKKFCPSFKSNSESSQRWSQRQQPTKAKSGYVEEASTVKKASFHCFSAISDSNRDGVLIFDEATVCGIPKRSLLRDSGCNTVAVRESLVPTDALTGCLTHVTTFCCKHMAFKTAIIDLDCGYFKGKVEACVVADPIADVILGNIDGLVHFSSNNGDKTACPVLTRNQRLRDQADREPSSAVADHESDVDNNVLSHVTDLAQRQKEDPTLKP
ncbi:reverse transcriptase [Elysia marginata]|uniref:Reverse transcriptase n=1 Tax=Elysia marginata TaxID=1093978 RepID=A0AAV4E9M0_9GAST|nr:reverse transcriptase [Elysia marginata]